MKKPAFILIGMIALLGVAVAGTVTNTGQTVTGGTYTGATITGPTINGTSSLGGAFSVTGTLTASGSGAINATQLGGVPSGSYALTSGSTATSGSAAVSGSAVNSGSAANAGQLGGHSSSFFAPATTGSTGLLQANGGGGFTNITLGSGLSITSGTINAAASGTDARIIGTGTITVNSNGTLGSAAFTASSAYAPTTSGTTLLIGNGSGGSTAIATDVDLTITSGTLIHSMPATGLPDSSGTLSSLQGNTLLVPSAGPSANRTLTLPLASTVPQGRPVWFVDTGGFMPSGTGAGTAEGYTFVPSGTNTINGGTSGVYIGPGKYSYSLFFSDGSNSWINVAPNGIRDSQGGAFFNVPTIRAPNDPKTGFGFSDGTNSPALSMIWNNTLGFTFTSAGGFGHIGATPTGATNYSGSYPSGGFGSNGIAINIGGAQDAVGWSSGTADQTVRLIQHGYSAMTVAMNPTTIFSGTAVSYQASTQAYFGDVLTPGAVTNVGIGKIPTVGIALDVTGAIQGDTSLTLTGTASANIGGTLIVGGGSTLKKLLSATTTFTGTISGTSTLTVPVSVAGSGTNDSVELGWSGALPAGIVVQQAYVSTSGTVSVILYNTTAATGTTATLTVRTTVLQF